MIQFLISFVALIIIGSSAPSANSFSDVAIITVLFALAANFTVSGLIKMKG